MRFTKKPVTIEAWQNPRPGEVPEAPPEWLRDATNVEWGDNHTVRIVTLEGTMTADPGDWIIRGVKGELYPCKPDIFAATYEIAWTDSFDFGIALRVLRDGRRVRRAGWNGKGMYLVLVPGGTSHHPAVEGGAEVTALPAIGMWTATKEFLTGWLASQTDMLATDWELAE